MNRIKIKKSIPYILMLLPLCILFGTFFIIPVGQTIYSSFFRWTSFSKEITFNGLDNYRKVIASMTTLSTMKNTFIYSIGTVISQNIIAVPMAVVLSGKLKFQNMFRSIYFAPAVLSTLVVGYLWSYIFSSSDIGLINTVLSYMNISPINWLGDAKLAMVSIITTQVWQWFGWCMVIYIANLQTIPTEYYEAADVDGASKWQQFWYVTFPLLTPAFKVNIIVGLISGLKVFDIVFALTKGGPGHATETILTSMFKDFALGNYGYSSAFSSLFLVVSLFFTAVLLFGFKKWEDKVL